MAKTSPEQRTQILLVTHESIRFLSINLISKTRYVGDVRIRVTIGCRASSSLQFELLPWCSLGKNVFISIPLVIFRVVR